MLKKIIIFSFFALILGCVGLKASNAETISLCVDKIEYGNFNTGDFIDDAANGFPNADEFDPNDWNGLTLEKAAEEVSNHCIGIDLIATVGRNCRSKSVTLYPDDMGYAGRKLFGLLREEE